MKLQRRIDQFRQAVDSRAGAWPVERCYIASHFGPSGVSMMR